MIFFARINANTCVFYTYYTHSQRLFKCIYYTCSVGCSVGLLSVLNTFFRYFIIKCIYYTYVLICITGSICALFAIVYFYNYLTI